MQMGWSFCLCYLQTPCKECAVETFLLYNKNTARSRIMQYFHLVGIFVSLRQQIPVNNISFHYHATILKHHVIHFSQRFKIISLSIKSKIFIGSPKRTFFTGQKGISPIRQLSTPDLFQSFTSSPSSAERYIASRIRIIYRPWSGVNIGFAPRSKTSAKCLKLPS